MYSYIEIKNEVAEKRLQPALTWWAPAFAANDPAAIHFLHMLKKYKPKDGEFTYFDELAHAIHGYYSSLTEREREVMAAPLAKLIMEKCKSGLLDIGYFVELPKSALSEALFSLIDAETLMHFFNEDQLSFSMLGRAFSKPQFTNLILQLNDKKQLSQRIKNLLLNLAVRYDNAEAVKQLISMQKYTRANLENNATAFYQSCHLGRTEVAQVFLQSKLVDVNHRKNPLSGAISGKFFQVATILLQASAKI